VSIISIRSPNGPRGGTIPNAKFPDTNRVDRSGDRTVQADRSRADDAADRSRIYGVTRKSAPGEQGHKVVSSLI